MSRHQDEFVEAAIFEVDFSKPTEDIDMEKTRFFSDFSDCGLFGGFSGFDMALGDGPTILGILDEEDFYILFVFRETKNDTASGRFADNLLNRRLAAKNRVAKLGDWGGFVLFRKGIRNFEITPLALLRLWSLPSERNLRGFVVHLFLGLVV